MIFIQSHPNNYFTGYLQNTYCFVCFLSKETPIDSIYKSCLHIFRTRPCKKHGSFFERVMKGTAQSHKFCLFAITLHFLLYGFISSGTSYFSANFSAPKKKSAAFSGSTLCANFDLFIVYYYGISSNSFRRSPFRKEKAVAEAPLPPALNGQLSVILQIFSFYRKR